MKQLTFILIFLISTNLTASDCPLIRATLANDISKLKAAINEGADFNDIRCYGAAPLHLSISYGYESIFDYLLEIGADPNIDYSYSGYGLPLSLAIKFERDKMVRKLLANGANPKVSSKPTFLAIFKNNLEMVQLLVENGADLEQEEDWKTPFYYAIAKKHYSIARYLLSKGANPDSLGFRNCRPIHEVAKNGNLEMLETLLAHGVHHSSECHLKETPMMFASEFNHVGVLERLFKAGANLNHHRYGGVSSVQISAGRCHYEAVKFFVDKGAYLNQDSNSPYNSSALEKAMRCSDPRIAEILRNAGAEL